MSAHQCCQIDRCHAGKHVYLFQFAQSLSTMRTKKVEMLFAHLKGFLKLDQLRLQGPNGVKRMSSSWPPLLSTFARWSR